jgi:hypothetical protein
VLTGRIECVGLVLRASGSSLSILSPQEGRVEKRWFKPFHRGPLHRGSLISYISEKKQGQRVEIIEHLDLEQCATQLAFQDIYLLHYILEVCHYFIPIGSEADQPFYFLVELFQRFRAFPTVLQKKIVLCKLLALLGVCPDEAAVQTIANRLRTMPIDKLLEAPLELSSEELISRWLFWCMEMHPKGKFFKAMPLLLEK